MVDQYRMLQGRSEFLHPSPAKWFRPITAARLSLRSDLTLHRLSTQSLVRIARAHPRGLKAEGSMPAKTSSGSAGVEM
jgi:hypothetical protein